MAGRLTRFVNLERPRKDDGAPPHEVATPGRFAAEQLEAERERRVRSGIEVDAPHDGEQPFLRCPVCESDNTKYAVRCVNCQRRLDTPEVLAWNRELWRGRQAEQHHEQEAQAKIDAEREVMREQNRKLGEALAREVGERERARLAWDGFGDSTPVGLRLLASIENATTRFLVTAALVAVFFGAGAVAFAARRHSVLQLGGFGVAAMLLLLFVPNTGTGRRRWRWWDWF